MIKYLVNHIATRDTESCLDLIQSKKDYVCVKQDFLSSSLDKKLKFAMKFNETYHTNFLFKINSISFIPLRLPSVNISSHGYKEIHIWNTSTNNICYAGDIIQIKATSELMFVKLWNSMMFKLSLSRSKQNLYLANAKAVYKKAKMVDGIISPKYSTLEEFAYMLPFEPFRGSKYQGKIREKLISISKEVL